MKKAFKSLIFLAISAFVFAAALSGTAFAADAYEPLTEDVPFEITNNTSEQHSCTVILLPKDGAPSPNKRNINLKSNQSGTFNVTFTKPGIYEYEMFQTEGTDESVTYDDTTYIITFYVTNKDSSTAGLEASMIIYPDGTDEKVESALFSNETEELPPEEESEESEEEPEKPEEEEPEEELTEVTSEETEEKTEVITEENTSVNTVTDAGSGEMTDVKNISDNKPKTGDSIPLSLVLIISMLSLSCIGLLTYKIIKK